MWLGIAHSLSLASSPWEEQTSHTESPHVVRDQRGKEDLRSAHTNSCEHGGKFSYTECWDKCATGYQLTRSLTEISIEPRPKRWPTETKRWSMFILLSWETWGNFLNRHASYFICSDFFRFCKVMWQLSTEAFVRVHSPLLYIVESILEK